MKMMNRLKALFELNFLRAALSWTKKPNIDLYTQSQKVLAETACEWVGIPVPYRQLNELSRDLTLPFDSSARTTVLHFKARRARVRLENWLIQMIDIHRNQRKVFPKNSPADILSTLKHPHGELLTQQETAVEILNLIRPLAAISVYFVFTLHSLHAHPEYRPRIMNSSRMRRLFIQEVRRFFPERYLTEMMSPFNFVPHGGGEAYKTHRCPGEEPSVMLIEQFLSQILHLFDFEIKTSKNLDTASIPPLPESRLTLMNFRKVQAPHYTERPNEILP